MQNNIIPPEHIEMISKISEIMGQYERMFQYVTQLHQKCVDMFRNLQVTGMQIPPQPVNAMVMNAVPDDNIPELLRLVSLWYVNLQEYCNYISECNTYLEDRQIRADDAAFEEEEAAFVADAEEELAEEEQAEEDLAEELAEEEQDFDEAQAIFEAEPKELNKVATSSTQEKPYLWSDY